MQRPIAKPVGAPVEQLDTPSLLLDLARLEANAAARPPGRVRLAAWVHGTPAIAWRQVAHLRASDWAGIAVRGVAEAEIFAAAGFQDIRILRPLVGAAKARADVLGRSVRLVCEDDGATLLGEAALDGAVTVSARVSSVPEPRIAIHDCGQKAIGQDFGEPRLPGQAALRASAGSAEHGVVRAPRDVELPFALGDWLQLVPADIATAFALHDVVHAVADGRLQAVWPISARGAWQ